MAEQSSTATVADSTRHKLMTGSMYCLVALAIVVGWRYSDLNVIHAESGVGYWLGIAGSVLMVLLLLYPMRKRVRAFRILGSVRHWFRIHMVFGIVGPLLIIFHSNYQLGSLNSRIALFCTLIVAASGIIGRYLYARIHYGLYGRSASVVSLRNDVNDFQESESGVAAVIPTISKEMNAWEDRQLTKEDGFIGAFVTALTMAIAARFRYWRLKRQAKRLILEAVASSDVVAGHQERLVRNTNDYLVRRITCLRKFTQFRAFERLFSLWHIVHYPLFLILVIAAIVHVFAVHMY